MAIQTLNTIKNWFRTGLKPTQTQFWDTWDSFRHKNQKVPVTDVEGIDELLNSKTDKSDFKTINGESILGSGDITVDGGSSQDLQSVLNNGTEAVFSDYEYASIMYGTTGTREIQFGTGSDADHTSIFNIRPDFVRMADNYGDDSGGFDVVEGITSIYQGLNGFNPTVIKFETPIATGGDAILKFPAKPTGTYTIATTEDITLQKILDNDAVATLSSSANTSNFEITADGLVINTESFDGTETNGFQVNQNGISIETYKNGFQTAIRTYSTPIANTSFEFPVKEEGTYTLATLEDIPVVDSVLPVSDSQSGIVNNTPLQELGGVDKIINGVRIGRGAGTTTDNLVVGDVNSMSLNTTGTYNTAIGSGSLNSNTTGESNTGIGAFALWANTTSNNNIAVGESSLQNLISGAGHNVAVGTGSLSTLVSGISNTGIGDFALWKASTGTFNTAVGSSSLQKVTTTSGNTAIGAAAGQNITGTFNVAVGYLSNGETGTTSTGNYNITMGYQSGRALTSGSNNILIENITNASITSGSNNIIIDSKQKSGVTTGNNNTLIGGWDGAFSPATSDTVALGTGTGVTRFLSASTGLTTLPTQTNALISADATGKAIITKSYSDNMGAVVNATTSALSGTALNSAYPSAIAGFRVHCLSISGGAIIYEKTTGGWIQYATTAVTP